MSDPSEAERGTVSHRPPARVPDESIPPAPTADQPALIITRGPRIAAATEIALSGEVMSVGRHPDCDIVLDDVTVSRQHAEVRRVDAGFTLTDLGSLNGTYVNHKPVNDVLLADGDTVWIGVYRLAFRSP